MASAPAEPDSSSDDKYLYVTSQVSKIPTVAVKINEITVNMIIDTGASIDILDESAYDKVNHSGNITLQPSSKQLFTYESTTQLHVLGSFTTMIVKNSQTVFTLHVLQGT